MSSRAIGDSITVLTIKDVHFKWHAGQHDLPVDSSARLVGIPPIHHCVCASNQGLVYYCNEYTSSLSGHTGDFRNASHNFAVKNPAKTLTGYVLGPFGVTTRWETFETLVLIGASTGASFTVPIMEYVAYSENTSCVRRLENDTGGKNGGGDEIYVERARDAPGARRRRALWYDCTLPSRAGYSETDSGVPLVQLRRTSRTAQQGSIKERQPTRLWEISGRRSTIQE